MTSKAFERQLEGLKADMENLDTTPKGEETEMATAPKKTAAKKSAVKKAPAKAVKAAPAKKKVEAAGEEGRVKLKDLAKEAKLEPHIARRQLRKAGVPNEGRWSWKDGSSELSKAREALGL